MSSQNPNLDKIEHIVVLMMENRSFDNVLGRLYPDNPNFNGVNDSMSNPRPDGELAYVEARTDMTAPYPDPNEPYDHVYMQQFNPPCPPSVPPCPPPCPIPLTTATPNMQGFFNDYVNAISQANSEAQKHGHAPFDVKPRVIMNCFEPCSLPVINGLARAYAVCDNWYSSVPTQTFPNRSFVHAATSSGNVYNSWGEHFWDKGIFINDTPTIYNLLEAQKIAWKIYHGGPLLLCNALYGQRHLWEFLFDFENPRFFPLQAGDYSSHPDSQANQFLADVQAGTLPSYTFIEPNMICSEKYGPENDMHPAFAIFDTGAPTNALYGDKLIYDVYTALRESDYWEKTLLIITFDEHGGCFDHQAPPGPAVAPDDIVIPANKKCDGPGSNFDFKRFGVRVPAVLVSPWIEQGTICHTQFDHTSVIKTASNKWLQGVSLTKRDANACDVSGVLTLPSVRTDVPPITPITPPTFAGCGSEQLSGLHRDMLVAAAMFIARNADRYIHLGSLKTRAEIIAALDHWGERFLAP